MQEALITSLNRLRLSTDVGYNCESDQNQERLGAERNSKKPNF